MKKLVAMLLVVVAMISLTACGKSNLEIAQETVIPGMKQSIGELIELNPDIYLDASWNAYNDGKDAVLVFRHNWPAYKTWDTIQVNFSSENPSEIESLSIRYYNIIFKKYYIYNFNDMYNLSIFEEYALKRRDVDTFLTMLEKDYGYRVN